MKCYTTEYRIYYGFDTAVSNATTTSMFKNNYDDSSSSLYKSTNKYARMSTGL